MSTAYEEIVKFITRGYWGLACVLTYSFRSEENPPVSDFPKLLNSRHKSDIQLRYEGRIRCQPKTTTYIPFCLRRDFASVTPSPMRDPSMKLRLTGMGAVIGSVSVAS